MSDIGLILGRIGLKLVTDVTPKLEGDYAAGHVSMTGLMAIMAGEMWDGSADRLNNEIKAMRALLDGRVDVSAIPAATSLKLSDLTVERDALAEKLIALQTDLEAQDGADAAALNTRVWGHLLQTAAARMPSPPAFPEAE